MYESPVFWIVLTGIIYFSAVAIPIGYERMKKRRVKLHELKAAYDDAVHDAAKNPHEMSLLTRALRAGPPITKRHSCFTEVLTRRRKGEADTGHPLWRRLGRAEYPRPASSGTGGQGDAVDGSQRTPE